MFATLLIKVKFFIISEQDVRHKSPYYIADLIVKGYVFAELAGYGNSENMRFILENQEIPCKVMNSSDYFDENMFKNKIMKVISREHITGKSIFKEYFYSYYKDPVKLSRDNLMTMITGIAFNRNYIFYETFREKMQYLFESGIIGHLRLNVAKQIKESKERETYLKEYEEKQKEVVLTWSHLYPGFYLWMCACIISSLAFLIELITYKVKNLKHHHCNLCNN